MPSYSLNNQIEELVKMTVKEQQPEQSDNTPKQIDESAKGQNFFQDNKNNKERKKYNHMDQIEELSVKYSLRQQK